METTKKRIIWFDVLRGFFIFLAMWEHWGAALNVWYIEYFKEGFLVNNHLGVGGLTNNIYQVHQNMLGKTMPYDQMSVWASYIFTPWVMAVYLTMAAFNLASRSQEDFSKVWKQKLSLYGTLLLFFIFENFIIAENLGEALTLYPLMTWMIILSLLTIMYRFTGLGGIIALFCLAMAQWFIPIPEMNIEQYIKMHIHPAMSLDASPHYFIASASLGFILGHLYYHQSSFSQKLSRWGWIIGLGVVMFAVGFNHSEQYYLQDGAYFKTEHLKASTFFGMVEIIGIQLVVLSLALIAHLKNITPAKLLNGFIWMGVNSLGIFALHRMFFFYLWMPIITWVTAFMGTSLPNGIVFVWPTIIVYLGFFYFLRKSKVLRLVMRD